MIEYFMYLKDDDLFCVVTNNGESYTTHSHALEYGATNYDRGNPPVDGGVYKIKSAVVINGIEPGFVIESVDRKHCITSKYGVQFDKTKYDFVKFWLYKYIKLKQLRNEHEKIY